MSRRRGLLAAATIILVSLVLARFMISLGPEPVRKPPPSRIPFAITVPAVVGIGAIPVYGAGTVRPSAEINVAAEVKGKVSWVDPAFRSGGRVREGQALFRIDTADYRNPNYHTPGDQLETLDYEFMGAVTRALVATLALHGSLV